MKSINISKITDSIEAQGIKVISIGYTELKSIQLKGALDSFIATVKAFNETVILIQDFLFDENDFFHELKKPA